MRVDRWGTYGKSKVVSKETPEWKRAVRRLRTMSKSNYTTLGRKTKNPVKPISLAKIDLGDQDV